MVQLPAAADASKLATELAATAVLLAKARLQRPCTGKTRQHRKRVKLVLVCSLGVARVVNRGQFSRHDRVAVARIIICVGAQHRRLHHWRQHLVWCRLERHAVLGHKRVAPELSS